MLNRVLKNEVVNLSGHPCPLAVKFVKRGVFNAKLPISRGQMKAFFRKIRVHFANQPATHSRILKELSTALESNADAEDLKNLAAKLFKSNQLLHDEFLAIFPKVMDYNAGKKLAF